MCDQIISIQCDKFVIEKCTWYNEGTGRFLMHMATSYPEKLSGGKPCTKEGVCVVHKSTDRVLYVTRDFMPLPCSLVPQVPQGTVMK